MAAAWPVSLPAYVNQDDFSEIEPNLSIRSPTTAGSPKTRRRFTAAPAMFSVSIELTAAQKATFRTFYITTLAGGSLPFDWVDPNDRTAATFMFVSDVQYGLRAGLIHVASFTLEKQL